MVKLPVLLLWILLVQFVQAQNVGIGTATPAFKTDIVDRTATTLLRLRTLTDASGSRTLLLSHTL